MCDILVLIPALCMYLVADCAQREALVEPREEVQASRWQGSHGRCKFSKAIEDSNETGRFKESCSCFLTASHCK